MLTFVLVGPLVGAAVVFVSAVSTEDLPRLPAYLLLYGLGGYVTGGIPAIVTAVVIGKLPPARNLIVHITLAVVVGAASSAVWSILASSWSLALMSGAGAAAGLICALLTRRWVSQ